MDKIALLGVTPHVIPEWEEKKRQMYNQACERQTHDQICERLGELPPVIAYTELPPVKICEIMPTPVCGQGKNSACAEHYQKQVAKRRKKNKNKKTHR